MNGPTWLLLSNYSIINHFHIQMARPKSDDKRNAILAAAIQVFAERGLNASPTSAISQAAGIAEGTLFTYFKTKDELINALYREIKLELADALMSDLHRRRSVRTKLEHLWNQYVDWGVAHPHKRKVLAQLNVSEQLTAATRAAGYEPFAETENMMRDAIAQKILRDYPVQFIAANLDALAQTTMGFMAAEPQAADRYRAAGFEVFWNGIVAE